MSSVPPPRERVALRLSLDSSADPGPLDGAWWPQSRDLPREAADLVDHFPDQVGRIEGLLFSRPDWDAVEGVPNLLEVQAARGPVTVGSFPSDDTHVIIATMESGQRLRLLVVPSGTEPSNASRVMRRVADDGNTETPSALLGLTGPDQSHIGDDVWDDHAASPTW